MIEIIGLKLSILFHIEASSIQTILGIHGILLENYASLIIQHVVDNMIHLFSTHQRTGKDLFFLWITLHPLSKFFNYL